MKAYLITTGVVFGLITLVGPKNQTEDDHDGGDDDDPNRGSGPT